LEALSLDTPINFDHVMKNSDYLCRITNNHNSMDTFLEILKYILPWLVIFITVFYLVKAFLDNEQKRKMLQIKKESMQITLPLRLQAYERLVLFLERISPAQILFRLNQQGMTAYQLHSAIMQNIREEYEHNLAQQIYVSPEAWSNVKTAKEEVVRLVNTSLADMKESSGSHDFARAILEKWGNLEKDPVQLSLDILKTEVKQLF
jgi:hypothetical protein